MTTERDVLEFIIVPPYNDRDAICRAKERFTHFLSAKFPGYTFRVVPIAPVDDEDEFNVIPVMSFVDDEGRMRMCNCPKLWLLHEIADACQKFDVSGRRHAA